jgi:hypothetical protein
MMLDLAALRTQNLTTLPVHNGHGSMIMHCSRPNHKLILFGYLFSKMQLFGFPLSRFFCAWIDKFDFNIYDILTNVDYFLVRYCEWNSLVYGFFRYHSDQKLKGVAPTKNLTKIEAILCNKLELYNPFCDTMFDDMLESFDGSDAMSNWIKTVEDSWTFPENLTKPKKYRSTNNGVDSMYELESRKDDYLRNVSKSAINKDNMRVNLTSNTLEDYMNHQQMEDRKVNVMGKGRNENRNSIKRDRVKDKGGSIKKEKVKKEKVAVTNSTNFSTSSSSTSSSSMSSSSHIMSDSVPFKESKNSIVKGAKQSVVKVNRRKNAKKNKLYNLVDWSSNSDAYSPSQIHENDQSWHSESFHMTPSYPTHEDDRVPAFESSIGLEDFSSVESPIIKTDNKRKALYKDGQDISGFF